MSNANILFYINLSGEVFYIITHRMKSQAVKIELQERIYNDLAICICHPVVVQNLINGSLQLLDMSMADIRILMDRIVHSSIMTVNTYSMEKLFELTLIATKYQYTVCQHPKDILLIALNHLNGIRSVGLTEPKAVQLCEDMHKILVGKFRGESSMIMQDYRYAILTYLGDVRLKMSNLIKLGFQKSTGEFVKKFPDKEYRKEFKQPGTIELFERDDLEGSDSSDSSDSNNEIASGESFLQTSGDNAFDEMCHYNSKFGKEDGCHFENISLQIHSNELEEEEFLEIEYIENSFQEVLEATEDLSKNSIVVKFSRGGNIRDQRDTTSQLTTFYELSGSKGIVLGKSIYDIPGNTDEDEGKHSSDQLPSFSQAEKDAKVEEGTTLDDVAIKAVHGLELCSIMLGCKNTTDKGLYKSPITSNIWGRDIKSSSPTSSSINPENLAKNSSSTLSPINVVKFDARTDRSHSKAALSKIKREFDLGLDLDNNEPETMDNKSINLYDMLDE